MTSTLPNCSQLRAASPTIATALRTLGRLTGLGVMVAVGLPMSSSLALAQTAAQPAAELPQIDVTAKKKSTSAKKSTQKKAPVAKAAPKQAAPAPAEPTPDAGARGASTETAKGPVDGVVAKTSATGTKTDTPIISTPQSISVIGREQMERQSVQTVTEAMRYTPGVRADTFGADPRNDWFLLRGFQAQTNGYFLDGLQLFSTAYATWKLEPFGLDRLEVLRGPSSALYGGGNPAGLINGGSKRPGPNLDNRIYTGIDENGQVFGAVDLNGGGATANGGEIFYRLNALGRAGDTQVDDADSDRYFVAPSLLWRPNSDTSITLLASHQRDETDVQAFLPYVGTVVPASFGRISTSLNTNNPGFGGHEREQTTVGYEIDHRLNEAISLRQNFRYGELDIDMLGLFGNGVSGNSLNRYTFSATDRAKQVNVDNQAEFRFGTGPLRHRVLVGLDYSRYTISDVQYFDGGTPLNLIDPDYPSVPRPTSLFSASSNLLEQTGVYLQDEIKVDRLTFLLTGRHDWVDIEREDDRPGSTLGFESSDSAYTYRAAAIYNFDNGLAPYVTYSTSFDPQVNPTSNTPFLPEEGKGWETGIKFEPRNFNARFTAAYFDITKTNVLTTLPGPPATQRQIGEVRSSGFEFEAVATPTPGLDLIASYTIYDLEVVYDGTPAFIGTVPKQVPEQFGGVYLDYTFQNGIAKGFGFGAGVRYVGRSFADDENLFKVPSYTLVDAGIHYEHNGWLTSLTVANLFDDTYVSGCAGVNSCFYGDRRRAMLTTSYKW